MDDATLFPLSPAVRRLTCHACRRHEHADHHDGVWTRADGSDPVICDCLLCAPADRVAVLIAEWAER